MSEPSGAETHPLQYTPLFALHERLGGKMVPFAGYAMPVQYSGGIIAEHTHTRTQAGLFDVSHMGQARLSGADFAALAAAFEPLVPGDVAGLKPGQIRYTLLLSERCGVLDDLMMTRTEDDALYLVVNAATKDDDFARIGARMPQGISFDILDERALLALQGPAAAACFARLAGDVSDHVFMTARRYTLLGADCWVSRSGYTGEDGFEISVPADKAVALAEAFLAMDDVAPVGLGARDSLRLEAGLCLYGHDLSPEITPVEADLKWAIAKRRRTEANFPGAEKILNQIAHGTERVRVGLRPKDRGIVREGAELLNADGREIGLVTSGTFGPSVGGPIAMGYVHTEYSAVGTEIAALVRGKPRPVVVSALPFVPHRYYRG